MGFYISRRPADNRTGHLLAGFGRSTFSGVGTSLHGPVYSRQFGSHLGNVG
jgi:hypothetical protein